MMLTIQPATTHSTVRFLARTLSSLSSKQAGVFLNETAIKIRLLRWLILQINDKFSWGSNISTVDKPCACVCIRWGYCMVMVLTTWNAYLTSSCLSLHPACSLDGHFVFSVKSTDTHPAVDPSSLIVKDHPHCYPVVTTPDTAVFKIGVSDCGAKMKVNNMMPKASIESIALISFLHNCVNSIRALKESSHQYCFFFKALL